MAGVVRADHATAEARSAPSRTFSVAQMKWMQALTTKPEVYALFHNARAKDGLWFGALNDGHRGGGDNGNTLLSCSGACRLRTPRARRNLDVDEV